LTVGKKICPEKANVGTYSSQDPNASDLVVLSATGDWAWLPHVDSCLGLCLRLKGGKVICAHVSMGTGGEGTMGDSFGDMFTRITSEVGNDSVAGVFGTGEKRWGLYVSSAAAQFQKTGKFFETGTYKYGVNVSVQKEGTAYVSECDSTGKSGQTVHTASF
jgi:hypothetical protein